MIWPAFVFSFSAFTEIASGTRDASRGLDPEDCNPHTTCEACAAETSWSGSCRWCGSLYDAARSTTYASKWGRCLGYSEFKDANSTIEPLCNEESAIYDEPAECSVCRNNVVGEFGLPRWWDPHGNPPATCSDRAMADQCSDDGALQARCPKACGIYSRRKSDPYTCPVPSSTASNFVQMVRDASPQLYDVLFVTEAGSMLTNFSHTIIRMTEGRGGEYSHALVISQVYPKLMVLEAVSNVEEHEPSGVREVAIEYAFLHVTKFELLRKRTDCGLHYPDGHAIRPADQREDGIEWARKRTNAVKNGRGIPNDPPWKAWAKPYASFDSFLSIGFTSGREMGYNDNIANEPVALYCSQLVAYVLYQEGCAFHSGTNLNVDPWEMYKLLGWSYNYRVVIYSDTEAHENAKQYTIEATRPWDNNTYRNKRFRATVCERAPNELDCGAVEEVHCTWLSSEVCVASADDPAASQWSSPGSTNLRDTVFSLS